MQEAIVELGRLFTLSIAMSVLGCSFMLACLLYLAKQCREARVSTQRIATITERIIARTGHITERDC
ncbi:MAG: hypothetical protein FJZ47_11830 [Candidatus Tectomicrobia bacterium]|uniref:Uncharacterized protein n=1 Tax=Tectimicrobiota bacterium TaxID=2528274 RepID=A0A938B4A4_UNCTE|nr:hypothetical protein [Candidatus Tectomicrobia bacterium]